MVEGTEAVVAGGVGDVTAEGVAPAVPVENVIVSSLRERLRAREKPTHLGRRTLLFIGSLLAFLWFLRDSGPLTMVLIVAVLLLHEGGHFVAMKAFGYENLNVFFVPFMGAAVSGRARQPGGWRAGVVSLAGPVPGVLLGALLLRYAPAPGPLRGLVFGLIFINGLNLLPFVPLDGGRLLSTVLFSRHRVLEIVGLAIGSVGLVATPDLLPGSPGIWAVLLGGLLVNRSKMIDASHRLRADNWDLDGQTSELPAQSLDALNHEARVVLGQSLGAERALPATVASLHESAATKPVAWPHAVLLFVVWAGAAGLAAHCWHELKHPSAQWAEMVSPDGSWRVEFPSPMTHTQQPVGPGVSARNQFAAQSSFGEFVVIELTLEDTSLVLEDDPEGADARLHTFLEGMAQAGKFKATQAHSLQLKGRPTLDAVLETPQGQVQLRSTVSRNRFIVLIASGASPADGTRFRDSFRVFR
jgi:Zn-dependent protease